MTPRTVTSVTTPAAETDLTTLERVKSELSLTDVDTDRYNLLSLKIREASSAIEAHLGRTLCRAGLTQTLWNGDGYAEYLLLDRYPVATITSVTEDGVTVSSSEYRLDDDTGALFRLDGSGYPCAWSWCKSVVIVFTAGYIMPGELSRDLPEVLESACVDLVSSFWASRGRDPLVRAEEIPGLGSVQYWVEASGGSGDLPPGVVSKIAPFRKPFA